MGRLLRVALAYGVIYVLLQMETFAFLAGTLLLFLILCVIMFLTRNLKMDDPKLVPAETNARPEQEPKWLTISDSNDIETLMNMTEDQAKKYLEVQRMILNKVSVTEAISIVFASLAALGIVGIIVAAFCLWWPKALHLRMPSGKTYPGILWGFNIFLK